MAHMRRFRFVLLAVLLTLPSSLGAQELRSGDRVRVILPESQPQDEAPAKPQLVLRGTLTQFTNDTLYMRVPGTTGTIAIPTDVPLSLHASRGVRSRGRSAVRAGLLAAIAGAAFTGLMYKEPDFMFGVINRGEAIALGGGFGVVTGGLYGAVFPTERWQKIRR